MSKKLITLSIILISWVVQANDMTWNYAHAGNPPASNALTLTTGATLNLTVSNISTAAEFDDFVQHSTFQVGSGAATSLEAALQRTYPVGAAYNAFKAARVINAVDLIPYLSNPMVNGDRFILVLKDNSAAAPGGTTTFVYTFDDGTTTTNTTAITDASGDLPPDVEQWLQNQNIVIDGNSTGLGELYNNESRYDKRGDRAYFFVDENGNLLGCNPVNIDQDDKIYVIMIGNRDIIASCNVDYIGTYAPTDLQMRNFEATAYRPNGVTDLSQYGFRVFRHSPFTSENVIIKIKKNGTVIATYTLRVNKLFHLGFGIGVNISRLQNQDFVTHGLTDTTNTIITKDGGDQTIFSVNVVWYWSSTIRYLFRGSEITRGRDVLKEPNFLERINPMFGVGIDKNFGENLFVGGNFEFARGGSISIGYHWGKVSKLNIPDFVLGETIYDGTAADIPKTTEWDGAFFVGIMLDTRVFNVLFNAAR